jgi:hypothetical protein
MTLLDVPSSQAGTVQIKLCLGPKQRALISCRVNKASDLRKAQKHHPPKVMALLVAAQKSF